MNLNCPVSMYFCRKLAAPALAIAAVAGLAMNSAAQTPAAWKVYTLTGTGVSIDSPAPFKLDQDKPDPFIEGQTAFVRWSLSYATVFSTITYEKNTRDIKTPREKLDSTARLFADVNKSTFSRVTDTTFMGEPAALFEEAFYDTYAKRNIARRMLVFGKGGELTTINISYEAQNTQAKAIADRMYSSAKKVGATATENSALAPIDWKRFTFQGLFFETPTTKPKPDCSSLFVTSGLYTVSAVCYQWGTDLSLSLAYRNYRSGNAPPPRSVAEAALAMRRKVDASAKLTPVSEVSITNLSIGGGDGVMLSMYVGYGTVGTIEEYYFIRKGAKLWEVRVERFVRWETTAEIANRIGRSFSFTSSTPQASSNTYAQHFQNGKTFAQKGEHEKAVAEFNEAAKLDGSKGELFFWRATSLEKLGRIQDAIHDYSKMVTLRYDLPLTYYNRGTMYLKLPDYPAAIRDLTAAIALDNTKASRYFNRGLAYYRTEDYSKAYVDFDAAARIAPKDPDNFIMMGKSACKQGLIMTAIHAQDKAIALGAKISRGCSK